MSSLPRSAKRPLPVLTSAHEPRGIEVLLTVALGNTLLSPFYARYVAGLGLCGDERVLDFGSGSGVCARYLARRLTRGGRLTCLDVSARWLETARRCLRRHANVSCILGHITTPVLPDGGYDLVVAHYALHHVPVSERETVFRFLAAKLAPDGRLAIRDPLNEWPSVVHDQEAWGVSAGLRRASGVVSRYRLAGEVYEAVYVRP